MSSQVFNITEIYQRTVPRGHQLPVEKRIWDSSEALILEVTPQSSPEAWATLIKSVRVINKSVTFTNSGETVGFIDLVYPNYSGDGEITHTFNTVADFVALCKKILDINSDEVVEFEFNPPIILKHSLTNKTFKIRLNSNVASIDSGSIEFHPMGWALKENDF